MVRTLSSRSMVNANFGYVAVVLYLLFSAVKMRHFLLEGRFWAEEGAVFYSAFVSQGILENVFFFFNGHLELVTNLVVYTSTFVKLKYAPLLTTYLSLAIQSIPIFLIAKYRDLLHLNRSKVVLLIIISTGISQSWEVWANSINLHFHFALLTAIIAAIGISGGPPVWVARILLVICGLSGIPANFLVPLFAFLAFKTKERERFIQFGILASTCFFQLSLLVLNNFEGAERQYLSAPSVFLLAPIAQSIISPLFGVEVGHYTVKILSHWEDMRPGSILFIMFFSLPLVYLGVHAFKRSSESTGILLLSGLCLLFFSIVAAMGNKFDLISVTSGGRYFYVSNVLLITGFLGMVRSYQPVIILALFALFISSVTQIKLYIGGPSWQSSYNKSQENNVQVYEIWPEGWSMFVRKPQS